MGNVFTRKFNEFFFKVFLIFFQSSMNLVKFTMTFLMGPPNHTSIRMVNFIQMKTYNTCMTKFICIRTIHPKNKFSLMGITCN